MLYTMDLNEVVSDNCSIHQFADDTQIYASYNRENAEQIFSSLNNTLKKIYDYSIRHGLKLNPSKSVTINFGNVLSGMDLNIILNGVSIQPAKTIKSLGVYIDRDLRFRTQVKSIVQRSYASLKSLYSNRHILSRDLKKRLCEALVLSHTNYGDLVFGPCLDVLSSSRVQKIQNSCIRFIYNLRRRDHVSHKLVELGWLNMHNRRKLHLASFVRRVLETGLPTYIRERLKHRVLVHDVDTRNAHLLDIPKHKTSIFKRSFSYSAVSVYNSIPQSIKVIGQ